MPGHPSPSLLVARSLPAGPSAPTWSPRGSGPARTPSSLTHLQDERLAMKGNLNGVHSVPVFLWEGQKGGREVGRLGGHGGRSGMGDRYLRLTAQGRKLQESGDPQATVRKTVVLTMSGNKEGKAVDVKSKEEQSCGCDHEEPCLRAHKGCHRHWPETGTGCFPCSKLSAIFLGNIV